MTASDSQNQSQPQKLLAIPGPVSLSPSVQQTLAEAPLSHVSPEFVRIFQGAMRMTREVVGASTEGLDVTSSKSTSTDSVDGKSSSQVFILAGSGTLGWDQVGANLVERGDRALVLHTGYFGVGFGDCLRTYGAQVDMIKAANLGGTVRLSDVEGALSKAIGEGRGYKMVTITHVDTSTGVLSDARAIAECVRRVSPRTLIILDAVCSLASEDVQMDAWGIDIILSASQKGLGAPPGLSILVASSLALRTFSSRHSPPTSYYSSWSKWLPIMRAYDSGVAAYFGTPAVNLVRAYHASLVEITRGPVSLKHRLDAHKKASEKVKGAAERLGMVQVATDPRGRANGMTAVYMPSSSVKAAEVLGLVGKRGVVMAGGLVSEIKDRYIRIGHMGWSVVGEGGKDVDRMVRVLEEAVGEAGMMTSRL